MDKEAVVPTLQAAEQLGVDVIEVYRMIDEGQLTASRDGKRSCGGDRVIGSVSSLTS
jgi:hypothetical protein